MNKKERSSIVLGVLIMLFAVLTAVDHGSKWFLVSYVIIMQVTIVFWVRAASSYRRRGQR